VAVGVPVENKGLLGSFSKPSSPTRLRATPLAGCWHLRIFIIGGGQIPCSWHFVAKFICGASAEGLDVRAPLRLPI